MEQNQPTLENLTPEQIEEGMLEKEKEAPHILDNHAAFFHMYAPKALMMAEKLNKKALLRVIELVMKYPIEESEKNFKSETERHLFNTLNQLFTSKYSMILQTGIEEMARQEAEKNAKEETDVVHTEKTN